MRRLGCAVTLNDAQDRVLAQPQPVADFPIRLTFTDQLEHFGGETVGLYALPGAPTEHDITPPSRGNAGADPLAQQISLELGQRGH